MDFRDFAKTWAQAKKGFRIKMPRDIGIRMGWIPSPSALEFSQSPQTATQGLIHVNVIALDNPIAPQPPLGRPKCRDA